MQYSRQGVSRIVEQMQPVRIQAEPDLLSCCMSPRTGQSRDQRFASPFRISFSNCEINQALMSQGLDALHNHRRTLVRE